jgi:hypothetical protein
MMSITHSSRTYLFDLGIEGIQVDPEIDPSIFKGRHAGLVVAIGVDVVDAYGVGSDLLHEGSIELALGVVDQRVIGGELVSNA